jgi:transcriptional regulator with XRE-family HTH domain
MADRNSLGERLRTIRQSRSMTVEQLAERTDLAPELIATIESGSFVPSLSPLIRIARALGVRLGTFLDEEGGVGPVVSRRGERETVVRFAAKDSSVRSDLDFVSLAANKTGRHMEPFLVDIHPASAQGAKLSSHEGEEFIYVLSGVVEIAYGRDTYRLAVGDSIYYDSIVPHHVHTADGAEARVVAVVYAP